MAFQQGLSGLNIASKALDAISNNVANSTTVGYKQSVTQFADLFASSLNGGGASQVGIGAQVAGVAQQFTQGNITVTNNPLDIAINGQGFFMVSDGGTNLYSRNGQFSVDKDGYIVNPAGLKLQGYGVDTNGQIVVTTPGDIRLDVAVAAGAPGATQTAETSFNLDSTKSAPSVSPFDPADTSSFNYSSSITIYDSLGNSHIMTSYFVKTANPNEWEHYSTLDGGAVPSAATTITFNSDGTLPAALVIPQSFTVTTGATSPLDFNLDLTNTTQYGSAFSANGSSQDGYSSGRLAGVSVGTDGVVLGRYTNGQSRNIGQVVLATFNNPDGLLQMGGNIWAETATSGPATVGSPDTGNRGYLQPAAVEDSNVDLTAELVNMITQQRAYQANAQSIKTQDQILQTLVNLR